MPTSPEAALRRWILRRWCKRAGLSPGQELDHLDAIILRARRAEASQLDISHLCDVLAVARG
jgi:hypothetical protein